MNQELLQSKPYHEVESIILDNQNKRIEAIKKEKEITILENQIKQFHIVKLAAIVGAISGIVALILSILQAFGLLHR